MGEWAAAFGRQEAIHSGVFMGVKPTNKKIQIRYMDFWKVENGKIVDNWVMVDFPHVLMHTRVWMSSMATAGKRLTPKKRASSKIRRE